MVRNPNTWQCKNCERRFGILTDEGLCYGCHIWKYGEAPKTGLYKPGEQKPMTLGKKGKSRK